MFTICVCYELNYQFSRFLNIATIAFSVASLVLSFLSYSLQFSESDLLDLTDQYNEEYKNFNLKTSTLDQWIALQNKYFVDTTYIGYLYNSLQSIQAILITILLFRLIFVFSFSIYLKAIVESIKKAGNDLLKYFVIFLPLLISFAFIFYQIWGSKVKGFNNLTSSLCSVILMTIGYMKIDEIHQIDTVWSIIYILLYYIMIIFLLFTFIMGILIESQHEVIMQKGYPSMQKSQVNAIIIFQWLFQWVPEKIQEEVRNLIKKLKNEKPRESQMDSESNVDDRKYLIQKNQLKGGE